MNINIATNKPTEADLEAAIDAAIQRAFPLVPQGSLRHQITFSFSLGHATIEIDAQKTWRREGRADVIIFWKETALIVLELKREGLSLSAADKEQALSYCRMLNPPAPLAVVTNGTNIVMLETQTGKSWSPETIEESTFQDLLNSAATVAKGRLKDAISYLMGSSPDIWVPAIRSTSSDTISELLGSWEESAHPFVEQFLLSRKATAMALHLVETGKQLISIEGPPLVGKSSVLRELVRNTSDNDTYVVFFVESDYGGGLIQKIADMLRSALAWPVTADEARDWLRKLATSDGPTLILAVDAGGLLRDEVRHDIEDLTAPNFGKRVRVVLAIDDVIADRIVTNSTGTKATAIGRRIARIRLRSLDNEEFALASEILWSNDMVVFPGGQSTEELRIPWILRAIGSEMQSQLKKKNDHGAKLSIPPVLGTEIIDHARVKFTEDETRRLYRAIGETVLRELDEKNRPAETVIESLSIFSVRRSSLNGHLDHKDISTLIDGGLVKQVSPRSGETKIIARLPELLASEISDLVSIGLIERLEKAPKNAASWIVRTSELLPLGDVISAQAIYDAAVRKGSLPLNFILSLVTRAPRKHVMSPGTQSFIYFPNLGSLEITFEEGGVVSTTINGQKHVIDTEVVAPTTYSDLNPWLILSHLAAKPFVTSAGHQDSTTRVDPWLLLQVGKCETILRRPGTDPDISSILTHDLNDNISIACHKGGIVEPVTWSIFRYLHEAGPEAAEWIVEALKENSLPLVARVDVALRYLSATAEKDVSAWASEQRQATVSHALKNTLVDHS